MDIQMTAEKQSDIHTKTDRGQRSKHTDNPRDSQIDRTTLCLFNKLKKFVRLKWESIVTNNCKLSLNAQCVTSIKSRFLHFSFVVWLNYSIKFLNLKDTIVIIITIELFTCSIRLLVAPKGLPYDLCYVSCTGQLFWEKYWALGNLTQGSENDTLHSSPTKVLLESLKRI